MKKKVGVRFKPTGKVYDFDCGAFVLEKGNEIIVETKHGLGYGVVVTGPVSFDEATTRQPLKKVFRIANKKDKEQKSKNIEIEKAAFDYCEKCITELKLVMNLFAVKSTFSNDKLIFFFTSEGRVDFRNLVKMLVKKLGARIEMRQVGVRNQAKMCDGIGRCGRQICCASFMNRFEPVSIRMAKEQNLSLNPTKISGLCGRLMCCLTFEYKTYMKLKKDLPRIGRNVECSKGKGRVCRHNVLHGMVTLQLNDGREIEINKKDIKKVKRKEVKKNA